LGVADSSRPRERSHCPVQSPAPSAARCSDTSPASYRHSVKSSRWAPEKESRWAPARGSRRAPGFPTAPAREIRSTRAKGIHAGRANPTRRAQGTGIRADPVKVIHTVAPSPSDGWLKLQSVRPVRRTRPWLPLWRRQDPRGLGEGISSQEVIGISGDELEGVRLRVNVPGRSGSFRG
jgi:hypothetical protein